MSGWDAMVADETRTCPHCNGHGWIQLSHDPDTDIDCPTCNGKRTS